MREPRDPVATSLKSGLEILRIFYANDLPLTNAEITERTGFPKSTVARLTQTLTNLGYLSQERPLGPFRLGDKVLSLGQRLLASLPICSLAPSLLQAFADLHNCSVALAGAHEASMVYLAHACGDEVVSRQERVGCVVPMGQTIIGHAYLSACTPPCLEQHLSQIASTAEPVFDTVRKTIQESAETFRVKGYCLGVNLWNSDMLTLAVPLVLQPEGVVLSLGCSVPARGNSAEAFHRRVSEPLSSLSQTLDSTMYALGQSFWGD